MIDVPVLVKDALREGSYRKNYRFVVYQADGATADFTIDNNKLISESVAFDERMCSDTELKFGLCEGTNLEFQCFNTPNITGRRIQAFIDVEYDNEGTISWYTIPMGWYTVEECSRQASTGNLKIKCFNKLLSDYLDAKANTAIEDIVAQGEDGLETASIFYILETLLEGYAIEYQNEESADFHPYQSRISYNASYITADIDGERNGYWNIFDIDAYF
jgi:hypothetical protein